jgi:hypothetical protein
MARRRLKPALFAGSALFVYALPAGAAGGDAAGAPLSPARVELVLPPCDPAPFDAKAFVLLLRIELQEGGITRLDVVAPGATLEGEDSVAKVTMTAAPCTEAATRIDLAVDDAATKKTMLRTIAVGDVARDARARALALAVAELLRASWSELALPNAPSPAVRVPEAVWGFATLHPATADPQTAERPATSSSALSAELAARFFPTYASALLGPRVAFSVAPSAAVPLRLRLDGNLLLGTSYDPLGALHLGLATAGAAVLVGRAWRGFDVEVGPHVEVGWGWASGQAAAASTQTSSGGAVIVDASIALDLRFALGAAFWATVDLDAGTVFNSLGVQADSRLAGGMGGPVAGMALGVARTF